MDPLLPQVWKEAPRDEELLSHEALAERLDGWYAPDFCAAGDVMLGGRAFSVLEEEGNDYPFRALRPLLAPAGTVLVNLEGPISRKGIRRSRKWVYRIRPRMGKVMSREGLGVLTLANNHILDCGREGLLETIQVARDAGIGIIGAGINAAEARRPHIADLGGTRVGFLGYYWHPRCAAGPTLPGAAMDDPEKVAADVRALKGQVDRVVVTCHWGVPYQREPSEEIRLKARNAVDAGADVVIGHHPHVIQPLEVHRGRPIFYSVGNFLFGTGNSRAEGLLVAVSFREGAISSVAIPLYVRNRDPRINFQTRAIRGAAGSAFLKHLDGSGGPAMEDRDGWGYRTFPAPAEG
jgi:poly-gamma-glutamate capsule biosynthesis protein CapA/YwtB (metallophosphatase superfamily)